MRNKERLRKRARRHDGRASGARLGIASAAPSGLLLARQQMCSHGGQLSLALGGGNRGGRGKSAGRLGNVTQAGARGKLGAPEGVEIV